jgi:NAD+ diphosphatase
MLGFVMRAATRDIVVDKDELEDARWVTRAEIRAADAVYVPPTFSLSGQLIALFLNDDL